MRLIYKHHQKEHTNLMNILVSVPDQFHNLPFYPWIHNNTPVNALTNKAHKILWNKHLIHMAQKRVQEDFKYVDSMKNISKFDLLMLKTV